MSLLDRIARALSDDALVSNLNRLNAEQDFYQQNGLGDDLDARRERAMIAAMRREYDRRTETSTSIGAL